MAEDDIPKSIIVVLVLLAVFISVLSTITIVSEINKLDKAPVRKDNPNGVAEVRFRMEDPNNPPGSSAATGKVTFRMEEVKENG